MFKKHVLALTATYYPIQIAGACLILSSCEFPGADTTRNTRTFFQTHQSPKESDKNAGDQQTIQNDIPKGDQADSGQTTGEDEGTRNPPTPGPKLPILEQEPLPREAPQEPQSPPVEMEDPIEIEKEPSTPITIPSFVKEFEFRYHGFDPGPSGVQGLDDVLTGQLYYSTGMPVSVSYPKNYFNEASRLDRLQNRQPLFNREDYEDPRRQVFSWRRNDLGYYYAFGSPPSPPNRTYPDVLGHDGGRWSLESPSVGMTIGFVGDSESDWTGAETQNCFFCHAANVAGTVVAGASNPMTDYTTVRYFENDFFIKHKTRFLEEVDQNIQNNQPGAVLAKEVMENYYLELQDVMRPILANETRKGGAPGPFLFLRRFSRLIDPLNQGFYPAPALQRIPSDETWEELKLPFRDSMAWWLVKYKTSLYWFNDQSPDQGVNVTFGQFMPNHKAIDSWEQRVTAGRNILRYMKQLNSPAYPKDIQQDVAQLGSQYFHGETPLRSGGTLTCHECHGQYRKDGPSYTPDAWRITYPNLGIIDVGTDPAYSDVVRGPLKAQLDERLPLLNQYLAANNYTLANFSIDERRGYVAPPLDGVWSTAPYFHNGSVPTIEAVLNSKIRPTIWMKNVWDPASYDFDSVGLTYKNMTATELEDYADFSSRNYPTRAGTVLYRSTVDTREVGMSNGGHTFGDAMDDDERKAVIEFLKAISGRDHIY